MYILYLLRSVPSLYLLEMPVNLSQYRGSVGVFNNRNFFVQSKVSHFFHLSNINSNNNYNLEIGPLILLNKIMLVLLLLNLIFLFKGNGSKHKKVIIWTLFSTFVSYNFLCWLYILLITLSGDVQLNPGPKLSQWHDKDTFGLHQIINEPTHILENPSSCIDLIFTSQPNLSVESETQPSLHPNCHHQIVYAIFNLEVIYPPAYTREVWHYQDSDVELIGRSLNGSDWDRAFANKHVDEKDEIFNKTVFNILSNFIPHEVIVCDYKDPPWFNGKIKSLINEKLRTYNAYRKNIVNSQLRKNLSSLQQRLRDLIDDSKQKYFSRLTHKLSTIQKSSKAYWALLKFFLNNRKIPVIPPLFHSNKFVTDFKEKAELFNSFFAKQCSLIKNDSKLPPRLRFLTDKGLSTIKFVDTDILKTI